jgi:GT2 family glycosyltransferase
MTERSLEALYLAKKDYELEIFLVENGSYERLESSVIQKYNLQVIKNKNNRGFAAAVNQGLELATGEYVLLLNSDAMIGPESLSILLQSFVTDNSLGIVGPRFVYPTGAFQPTCGLFPTFSRELLRFSFVSRFMVSGTVTFLNRFNKELMAKPLNVDWVSGGCMLIKQEVLEKIGNFDEHFVFGVEDLDFCFRAKATGFSVAYNPMTEVVHFHAFSSGGRRSDFSQRSEKQGMLLFLAKHYPEQKIFYLFEKFLYSLKLWKNKIIFSV